MNKGFTLIEVLITIVVLAIAAGALTPVIRLGVDSWVFARDQKEVLAEGALAMNRMIAEIRQADQMGGTACGFGGVCLSDGMSFMKVNDTTNTFRFYLASSRAQRMRWNTACSYTYQYLTTSSTVVSFTYLDQNGNDCTASGCNNCADIRVIRIKLILAKGGRNYVFQTTVRPINLP